MKDFFPFDVIISLLKTAPLTVTVGTLLIISLFFEGSCGINETPPNTEIPTASTPVATESLFNALEEKDEVLTSSDSIFDFEILARRVGCGLATAGLGGVGTGIGMVFRGLIEGLSRNPSVKDDMFSYAIFGFALTEAIGLFSLMIAFMLLYA